ncbi:uncharacterized protein I303_105932 [Kwoniella dejecticola CBS 10117]|uniref:Uncharacterized protein n=1 Tax=Kwoniella dejecticola CBS 10117 TaxID=1296121 RepID=A0A1A6A0S5_9TREE|nr:uncharacterized protein I303_05955 [Kwoniella dejecticola CBS 10117]OBR83675.1 hypothetical protein I303_05955 [Kwoniella dejecticola CBS 10117]
MVSALAFDFRFQNSEFSLTARGGSLLAVPLFTLVVIVFSIPTLNEAGIYQDPTSSEMAIFSNKFRCGRTTPQMLNHPFTEGADPPTPLTASHPAPNTSRNPPSAYHESSRSPQKSSASPATTARSTSLSPFSTPIRSRGETIARPPSAAGRARVSPTKSCKSSNTTTPTSGLPPLLPPPSYALPPTPEASPDRRSSVIFVGNQHDIYTRKPSLGSDIKALPAPPSSFTSPFKHARAGSHPSKLSQSPSPRSPSASASTADSAAAKIPNPHVSQSNPRSLLASDHSLTTLDHSTKVGLPGHAEQKHRPMALKLRTSNLDPEVAEKSRVRIKGLPTIDLSHDSDVVAAPQTLIPPTCEDPPKSSCIFNIQAQSRRSTLQRPIVAHEEAPAPLGPSPTHRQSEETIRATTEAKERPRSFSTNDALNITDLDKLRSIDETPRKQRSQPTLNSTAIPVSPTPQRGYISSSTPVPPSAMSEMSVTPGSMYTSLPTGTSAGPSHHFKPFENLPIPWSTIPASDLHKQLGDEEYNAFMGFSLHSIQAAEADSPPRLLPLDILRTSASEEARLRSELERLKEKHVLLVAQRETLSKKIENGLFKIDQIKLHKMVQALGQATGRVDRVSRQIYICNDQINQIECQAKEHLVGVLRIALKKKEDELKKKQSQPQSQAPSPSDLSDGESSHIATPRSTLSSHNHIQTQQQTHTTTIRFLDPQMASPRSPAKSNEGMSVSICPSPSPLSTATVINIDSLSFPIPPDGKRGQNADLERESEIESLTSDSTIIGRSEAQHSSVARVIDWASADVRRNRLEVEICQVEDENEDEDEDFGSTDSHATAICINGNSATNEILIYPPGHSRSLSAPILGLEVPLSAYTSSDDHHVNSIGQVGHQGWSHGYGHERSVSENDYQSHPPSATSAIPVTAPLRVNTQTPFGSGKSRMNANGWRQVNSLTVKVSEKREETKRARMGRESLLETPESILSSLATAPMWTKYGYEA